MGQSTRRINKNQEEYYPIQGEHIFRTRVAQTRIQKTRVNNDSQSRQSSQTIGKVIIDKSLLEHVNYLSGSLSLRSLIYFFTVTSIRSCKTISQKLTITIFKCFYCEYVNVVPQKQVFSFEQKPSLWLIQFRKAVLAGSLPRNCKPTHKNGTFVIHMTKVWRVFLTQEVVRARKMLSSYRAQEGLCV